jgi:hypothetical protein
MLGVVAPLSVHPMDHPSAWPGGFRFFKMQRRVFFKTAGGLCGTLLRYPSAFFSRESATEDRTVQADTESWELSNAQQRIVAASRQGTVTYQSFVLDEKGGWASASTPENHFVVGPSFQLALASGRNSKSGPDSVLDLRGSGQGRGKDGSPLEYTWRTAITSPANSPWFRFATTLDLPRSMRLDQGAVPEPQIILWLSSVSTLMEGQSGSWRRILLDQPTRNSLGMGGNDLPAVYLQDANAGIETMMYFDMSEMGWMSFDNIPRFLGYRCSTVSVLEPGGKQRLGVGLIANQATGDTLPAGEAQFTWFLMQRRLPGLITEQEAVKRWMEALLPLFRENVAWPKCATNWKQFAAGAVQDLQQKDTALVTVNGHRGLRAYVKATSQLWHETGENFELMTMADVLWPSLLYLKLHTDSAYQHVVNELLESLPLFYRPDTKSISNDFIRGGDETADSWYPFENSLVKYPVIGTLSQSKTLTDNFLHAYETAMRLAHRYNYLFPIYYRTDSLEQKGAGTNYAVGGLYAWGGVIAHRLTAEEKYLDEARRAIDVLTTVRAATLFHEPQELAYGALAAAELAMPDAARYLLCEQLRLLYWYSDRSQKTHDIRGMFQACASILYPAFKENVEAILPWTALLKRGVMAEGLFPILDQQRRNNFYYFDACHESAAKPSPFIPYENLGTLELGGRTGDVGKEIYGSGEVLWLYLMFEALGTTRDRELMLVNLDLLDAFDSQSFPPHELNFILFNPTDSTRMAEVSIPVAKGAPVKFIGENAAGSGTFAVAAGKSVRLKAQY